MPGMFCMITLFGLAPVTVYWRAFVGDFHHFSWYTINSILAFVADGRATISKYERQTEPVEGIRDQTFRFLDLIGITGFAINDSPEFFTVLAVNLFALAAADLHPVAMALDVHRMVKFHLQ